MDLEEFRRSLADETPPGNLNPVLRALWTEAHGDWKAAHKTVQDIGDTEAAWVHAYLHRKEGDDSNAAYWYARAGRALSPLSFEDEWDEIAAALLRQAG